MKKKCLLLFSLLFFLNSTAQIISFSDPYLKAMLLYASSTNQIASSQSLDENYNVSSYNYIDLNGNLEIEVSEASLIKYLDLQGQNISNIDGLEYFTNLQYLDFSTCQLSSVIFPNFTNLLYLDCASNQMTNLDVSNLSNLKVLNFSSNLLTTIDLSNLVNLEYLYFTDHLFTTLDLNNLTQLIWIDCSLGELTSLDVSNLTNLEVLFCARNNISNIVVNGLNNLYQLECNDNQLTNINLTGLASLSRLNCNNNQLTNLDISTLGNLNELYCQNNQLSTLNIGELNNLYFLVCNNNLLTNLNTAHFTNLLFFVCNNNLLTSIDISLASNMQTLVCDNNELVNMYIKNSNVAWQNLTFSGNQNLEYICADTEDIGLVQQKNTEYGYTNCQVDSDCSLKVNDFYNLNDITLFPNPAKNVLSFSNLQNLNILSININNILGQTVFKTSANDATIDIYNLKKGMYTIDFITEIGALQSKFIKD